MAKDEIDEDVITESPCAKCDGRCCNYIALEIDKPTAKRDYDHIRWYLVHEKVQVFIDFDGSWFLQVETKCKNLLPDHKCAIYERRPDICRGYPPSDRTCEFVGDGDPHARLFKTEEEFINYLNEKKIKWRFNSHKLN